MMLRRDRRLRTTGHLEVPKRTVANDGTPTNAICRSKRRNKPRLHEFDAVDAFEASQRECLGAHPHQLHIKRRRQAVLVKHPIQAKQSRSENVAVQVRV
jgi:hypothetical protein